MSQFNPTFQYYTANVKNPVPVGDVDLNRFVEAVTNPKPHMVQIMNQIRKAAEQGDTETKTRLKEKLYYFTPCAYVNGRRKYDNITHFTGLLILDFDKLESREYAEDMKQAFFHTFEQVIFCWLSSSGKGFRALLQIPVVKSTDEFKTYFNGAERKFGDLHGFDKAPKNCVLPLFLSIDRTALYRPDATMFLEQYTPPEPVKQPTVYYPKSSNDNRVLRLIENKINSISDAGHPVVRATSYYVGGLVAAGHCSEWAALEKLEQCIRAHHYTGNPAKVKTYLRTMKEMFNKGKESETNFIQR